MRMFSPSTRGRVPQVSCTRNTIRSLARALPFLAALAWSAPLAAQDITVGIDQARILRLDQPGMEFIIGNPSIADISVQSGQQIVITGKSFGITNLIVLDGNGDEILNRRMTVTGDPKRVVTLYKGASRQSYDCNTDCQPIVMPGDATEYFAANATAVTTKATLAAGAMNQDGQTGQ